MIDDLPRVPRAQARREMAVVLAVVVVGVLAAFTWGAWIGFLEQLDVLSAGATLVVGAVALAYSRGRGGTGWAVARGVLIALGITLAVVALLFGACVATQCVG